MAGGKRITIDMMKAASERGWSAGRTARHYGLHRKSVDAACERFGVVLPLHGEPFYGEYGVLEDMKVPKVKVSEPKSNALWSCSPAAVERALKRAGKA